MLLWKSIAANFATVSLKNGKKITNINMIRFICNLFIDSIKMINS